MSVPGKLRPSPYEMTPIVTDRLVATEYNRWPGGTHGLDERTVERTKESRAEQLAALNAPVNRRYGRDKAAGVRALPVARRHLFGHGAPPPRR